MINSAQPKPIPKTLILPYTYQMKLVGWNFVIPGIQFIFGYFYLAILRWRFIRSGSRLKIAFWTWSKRRNTIFIVDKIWLWTSGRQLYKRFLWSWTSVLKIDGYYDEFQHNEYNRGPHSYLSDLGWWHIFIYNDLPLNSIMGYGNNR